MVKNCEGRAVKKAFQSTPDLVNRENVLTYNKGGNKGNLFQSTPDLVNRENAKCLPSMEA